MPLPGDLPDAGIEPGSPAWAGGFLTTEPDPGSFSLTERTFETGPWLSRASHVTLSEECPVKEKDFLKSEISIAKSKRSSQALPGAQQVLGESRPPPPRLDLHLPPHWAGPPSTSSPGLDLRPPPHWDGPPSASVLGWVKLQGRRGTSGPGNQGVTQGQHPCEGQQAARRLRSPLPLVRGAAESGLGVQAGVAGGSLGPTSLLRTQGTFSLSPRTCFDQTPKTTFTRGPEHR